MEELFQYSMANLFYKLRYHNATGDQFCKVDPKCCYSLNG